MANESPGRFQETSTINKETKLMDSAAIVELLEDRTSARDRLETWGLKDLERGHRNIVRIAEHGVTSLVDLGLPVGMADLDIALRRTFERCFGPE